MPNPVAAVARLARLAADPASDPALLSRFLAGDAAALEGIVRRHGPTVLGVCRRALGTTADADDAFQATFLTLVRRAGAIRRPAALGAWLHGVALRCSRKALRRQPAVAAVEPVSPADPFADVAWRDLRTLLDQELARLPEKYRAPLVLCHLDGRTRDEAARQLGWSLRTLDRRLARARDVLKARLTRRGVAPIGLGLAVLGGEGLKASVPPSLIQAACGVQSGASPAVRALAIGPGPGLGVKMAVAACLMLGALVAVSAPGTLVPPADPPAKEAPPAEVVVDTDGDALPDGALRRFGSARFRHPGSVAHSVLTPDGKLLAIGSWQLVEIYDTATGKPVRTFRDAGMTNSVGALPAMAVTPDGKLLAHIVRDGPVVARVLDLETGKEVCSITGLRPDGLERLGRGLRQGGATVVPTEYFHGLHFADGGKTLVVVGNVNLHRFDARTGKALGKTGLPHVMVASKDQQQLGPVIVSPADPLAFSADATRLACVQGNQLRVIDVATGKELFKHTLEDKYPFAALSPDGGLLAIPQADRRAIELWDVAAGKKVKTLAPPVKESNLPPALAAVTGLKFQERLRFSPDGKTLFAGAEHAVYRWDLATGDMLPPLLEHSGYGAPVVHASADGKSLVTIGSDGVFRRFDPTTGKAAGGPLGYAWYTKLAISPDGKWAVVGDGAGRLDLWDLSGTDRHELKPTGGSSVMSVHFSPDSRTLAAGLSDGTVEIWDIHARRIVKSFVGGLKGSGEGMRSIVYLPSGELAVTGAAVGVRLWDKAADRPKWTRELREVEHLAASPDGKWIAATLSHPAEVHLLDAATGETRHLWHGSNEAVSRWTPGRPAFTPDGRRLLTPHQDGKVRAWDLATGREDTEFGLDTSEWSSVLWDVAVSPDGRWAAVSDYDDNVRIWELATGKPVLERKGPGASGSFAAFVPDGRRIVTSGNRGAMLWSLRPGKSKGDRESLWADLAAEDPAAAYRAQWGLLDGGPGVAGFLREKVGPAVQVADEKTIRSWVADLDAPVYRKREEATRELARIGRGAEAVLREVQPKATSDEQGKRIGQLLARLTGDRPPDELRLARAIQVLGLSDEPDAAAVIGEWAGGASGAPLTEFAKAARRGR
jgi:RNA polymerase sigma factor (sigma-70 family)